MMKPEDYKFHERDPGDPGTCRRGRGEHEYLFDDDMHHTAINAVLDDDMGRTTLVPCQTFAKFNFGADAKIVLKEAGITVQIEGEQGTGWCEFCWNRNYFEFARAHAKQFQPYKELVFARS